MYGYRWCRALFLGTKTLAIDYCQHLHIAHRQYTLWHIAQTILKFNIEESKSKLWRARDRTGRVLWQSLRHYGSLYVKDACVVLVKRMWVVFVKDTSCVLSTHLTHSFYLQPKKIILLVIVELSRRGGGACKQGFVCKALLLQAPVLSSRQALYAKPCCCLELFGWVVNSCLSVCAYMCVVE